MPYIRVNSIERGDAPFFKGVIVDDKGHPYDYGDWDGERRFHASGGLPEDVKVGDLVSFSVFSDGDLKWDVFAVRVVQLELRQRGPNRPRGEVD